MSSKKIQNNDTFERINYLHQATKMVQDKNPALSAFYGSLMKQLQKKAVLKIDPSIKRDLCKRCSKAFSESTAIHASDDQSLIIECDLCKYQKKYPIN